MPVYNGSNEVNDVKLGTTQIDQIFLGTDEVWTNYKETLLGDVTIYATGDYGNNYYSTAKAYLIRDKKKWQLKITGYWTSMGNSPSANVTTFPTNINVGPQKANITVPCNCFYNSPVPTPYRYGIYNGYVDTSGNLYLTLSHENIYRSFNQYDFEHLLIDLNPA